MMRKRMNLMLMTAFVVVFIFISFALTVMSRDKKQAKELEAYYTAQEKQLNKDTRAYLNMKGYKDSGVTITRVAEEEKRDYTVTIHHKKFDLMSEEERESIAEELSLLAFADENCSFEYEFLFYE